MQIISIDARDSSLGRHHRSILFCRSSRGGMRSSRKNRDISVHIRHFHSSRTKERPAKGRLWPMKYRIKGPGYTLDSRNGRTCHSSVLNPGLFWLLNVGQNGIVSLVLLFRPSPHPATSIGHEFHLSRE